MGRRVIKGLGHSISAGEASASRKQPVGGERVKEEVLLKRSG